MAVVYKGMKRWAWAAAAGAAALLAVLWLSRPDPAKYPVRGIDVSHHQGKVDWQTVAKQGVTFAFIKASEGGDHRDRRFAENWPAARAAGLRVGAYHFFTFCKTGEEQAANLLGALGKDQKDMLPPAVDLEFLGNCAKRPAVGELRAELLAFEKALGRKPGYHVTLDFMRAYGKALPEGADVWVRSVTLPPSWTFRKRWVFWQYSGWGRMDGIDGPVDLNVFHGTQEDWAVFAR